MTRASRWKWFAGIFFYSWLLYFATNQQSLVAAHALPLTAVDRAAPFAPWTGWIYILVFVLPLAPCLLVRNDHDVKMICRSFLALTTVTAVFFFLYPTIYPRPDMTVSGFVDWPLAVVRLLDTPKNCFPSQHVAVAFLSAFFIRRFSPKWSVPALLLAVAISISTLTTKQHYFWDVLSGFASSVAAYALV